MQLQCLKFYSVLHNKVNSSLKLKNYASLMRQIFVKYWSVATCNQKTVTISLKMLIQYVLLDRVPVRAYKILLIHDSTYNVLKVCPKKILSWVPNSRRDRPLMSV